LRQNARLAPGGGASYKRAMIESLAVPEEVTTRRLRLRRHTAGDVDAFQGFMIDPVATRYMPFEAEQKTAAGAKAMLLDVAELYDSDAPVFSLTITLAGADRYLGSCGLSPTEEDGVVEIYFTLVPAAQGHGYATEAVEGLVDFCRNNGTRRLVARVFDDNRPSIAVLRRSGFKLARTVEGELGPASVYALEL
jgi:RimJ/RimL family protein N-acetyltransferase